MFLGPQRIPKKIVKKSTFQITLSFALCILQTAKGITHNEGGWPKDICKDDEELTTRYRRKLEKSEIYMNQMRGLTKVCDVFSIS